MRRRLLLLAATVAALLCSGVLAAAAGEDATVRQAWTRTGVVPTFVPEEGRIYVAADAGVEQARAFVAADGQERTVRLHEAGTGLIGDAPALLACPLTSPLTDDGELSGQAAPAADCETAAPVERGEDGQWNVSLGDDTAYGVALVPDVADRTTFRLAFDPGRTADAPMTRTPTQTPTPGPASEEPPAAPAPADAAAVDVPALDPASSLSAADVALPSAPVPAGDAAPAAAGAATPTGDTTTLEVAAPAVVAGAAKSRSAGTPPAALVLGLVGLVSVGPAVQLGRRAGARARSAGRATAGAATRGARWVSVAPLVAAAVILPGTFGEATVYKLGLVLIVIVGAIGLHLLVNWAGELSLAHATMIGLPAFAVAKISADHGISPILLLPLGIAVGAAAGAVVGAPAIRARGLQVAVVTLAAGIAIDRFFFTKEWFVGPAAGAAVPVPSLGPIEFRTARALYPVLIALVAAAVLAAWVLYRSKLARGLLWIKADKAAAAAFGIPVNRYRSLAYVLAGAFAGLAGGLTTMWVQRLTPQAFPLDRSFTYLIVVVLAGRGFLGGVAAGAFAIEGGRLFLADGDAFMTYAGPIGLLLTLITNRDGFNGVVAKLRRRELSMPSTNTNMRPLIVAAVLAIAAGFAAIGLAWYHAGNTTEVWVQNQELISGGVGGIALIVLGVGLLVYDRIAALITVLELKAADEPPPS